MNHLTSRSALAMALAVPLVLPVPALAFEASGNDIADRFMEIMEAGNATVTGYDSVAESGDTVTIPALATSTDGTAWPNWVKLRSAVSLGCIRMLNKDVVKLFQQVDVGTPVVVTNN